MLLGADKILKVVHTDHPVLKVLEQVALVETIKLVGAIELLGVSHHGVASSAHKSASNKAPTLSSRSRLKNS